MKTKVDNVAFQAIDCVVFAMDEPGPSSNKKKNYAGAGFSGEKKYKCAAQRNKRFVVKPASSSE